MCVSYKIILPDNPQVLTCFPYAFKLHNMEKGDVAPGVKTQISIWGIFILKHIVENLISIIVKWRCYECWLLIHECTLDYVRSLRVFLAFSMRKTIWDTQVTAENHNPAYMQFGIFHVKNELLRQKSLCITHWISLAVNN